MIRSWASSAATSIARASGYPGLRRSAFCNVFAAPAGSWTAICTPAGSGLCLRRVRQEDRPIAVDGDGIRRVPFGEQQPAEIL